MASRRVALRCAALTPADQVLERVMEDISFNADKLAADGAAAIAIDTAYVDARTGDLLKKSDMRKFIL